MRGEKRAIGTFLVSRRLTDEVLRYNDEQKHNFSFAKRFLDEVERYCLQRHNPVFALNSTLQ